MGLREVKAARTREQIVDVALDLFIEQGYDETTMEQIAERAEVGSSTLYRYFPSKDLLILHPFMKSLDLGALLHARPGDEPLRAALGGVIHDSLTELDDSEGRIAAVRRMVDNAPVPRARLWDVVAQLHLNLEREIAARLGRAEDELLVMMTARVTFSLYEIAAERWWAGDHRIPSTGVVDEVLQEFGALELILPTPPAS